MLWEVDLTNSNFHWTVDTVIYLALTRERMLSVVGQDLPPRCKTAVLRPNCVMRGNIVMAEVVM